MAGVQAGRLEIEIVAEIARLQADLDKAKRAVKAASGDIAISAKAANDNLRSIGQTGKMTAFQARNMAFQFQDLGVQMAMAAQSGSPLKMTLMALAMQGPQITSIMKEAGMSAGDLAKNMASGATSFARAHPILLAVTAAVGAAAGGLALFTNEIEKTAKLDEFVKGLGLTQKEMKELGPVGITAGDAIKGLWKTISDGLGLDKVFSSIAEFASKAFKNILNFGKLAAATIYGSFFGAYRGITAVWDKLPSVLGEAAIGAANLAISAVEGLINRSIDALNSLISFANPLMAAAKMAGINVGAIGKVSLARLNNPYAGSGADAGKAFAGGFKEGFNDALGAADKFIQTWEKNTIDAAKDRLGKKAGEIIGERTKKAAGKAGKDAAEEFAKEYEKFSTAAMNGLFKTMEEAQKTWASNDAEALRGVQDELIKNQRERTQAAIDEAEANKRLSDELRGVIDGLDRLGGMGSVLGDIGSVYDAIKTGDYSGVRGPTGMILSQLSRISWTGTDKNGDRISRTLGETFSNALDKVFGRDGSFIKLLEGAGTGLAIGQILYGKDKKGSQIGGAIGGAGGYAIGYAFAGPAGGEIGKFIGSLIGSTIGSLFNGTKYGAASIQNGKIVSAKNSSEYGAASNTAANGIAGTLENIASQLGGSVGNYAVSIGLTNGNWNVNPGTVKGRIGTDWQKDTIDFKKDQEGAIRWAIANAIADGAIQGVREGTQRLLRTGGELEAAVAKALKFENVFNELKANTDPLGAALDKLNKQFADLRTIFAEAGASAEDYAQLEQLLAIKRKEAQDDAKAALVDKVRDPIEMQIRILELLGKEEDALAASRLLELAGLKGTLQPLQTMIYQLEDAQKVIATFEPLAEDLKAFRKELLGGQGEQSFGYIASQFRTIAQAAANGDATALGQLRGAASNYMDTVRLNAGSDLEYRRALGTVLASVDKGIFAAETQVDYAQAQIDAINNSANILASLKEELATLQTQIVENTGTVARMWQRFEVNGLPVITNPAEPIQVQVVAQ
ncbi:hypothetical protein ACQKOE_13790 [Novosphingobium sp. NPDC080210]|uniref:hypothetical protein n=1 Tax=Novosphingobium sp. NPDC080210 TaxID=3390596 RepID=UPI003D0241A1